MLNIEELRKNFYEIRESISKEELQKWNEEYDDKNKYPSHIDDILNRNQFIDCDGELKQIESECKLIIDDKLKVILIQ